MKSDNFLLVMTATAIIIASVTEVTPLLRVFLIILAAANARSMLKKIKNV